MTEHPSTQEAPVEVHAAQPSRRPGAVLNRAGFPCPAARRTDYPLTSECAFCGDPIICADGTADWSH